MESLYLVRLNSNSSIDFKHFWTSNRHLKPFALPFIYSSSLGIAKEDCPCLAYLSCCFLDDDFLEEEDSFHYHDVHLDSSDKTESDIWVKSDWPVWSVIAFLGWTSHLVYGRLVSYDHDQLYLHLMADSHGDYLTKVYVAHSWNSRVDFEHLSR